MNGLLSVVESQRIENGSEISEKDSDISGATEVLLVLHNLVLWGENNAPKA